MILSVVLFGLVYNPNEACSLNLVDHGRGYLGILLSCMIAEMAIIWLSMRGGILYTEPRESMQYVLYVRLGKGHPPWVGAAPAHSHPTPVLGPSIHSATCQGPGPVPAPGSSGEQADLLGSPLAPGGGVGRLRPEGQVQPTICF